MNRTIILSIFCAIVLAGCGDTKTVEVPVTAAPGPSESKFGLPHYTDLRSTVDVWIEIKAYSCAFSTPPQVLFSGNPGGFVPVDMDSYGCNRYLKLFPAVPTGNTYSVNFDVGTGGKLYLAVPVGFNPLDPAFPDQLTITRVNGVQINEAPDDDLKLYIDGYGNVSTTRVPVPIRFTPPPGTNLGRAPVLFFGDNYFEQYQPMVDMVPDAANPGSWIYTFLDVPIGRYEANVMYGIFQYAYDINPDTDLILDGVHGAVNIKGSDITSPVIYAFPVTTPPGAPVPNPPLVELFNLIFDIGPNGATPVTDGTGVIIVTH